MKIGRPAPNLRRCHPRTDGRRCSRPSSEHSFPAVRRSSPTMKRSRITHVTIIILLIAFGYLAIADATAVASTKLSLKFCLMRDCKTKGEFLKWNPDCFCCMVMPGFPCWHSAKECQANCRPCNPTC